MGEQPKPRYEPLTLDLFKTLDESKALRRSPTGVGFLCLRCGGQVVRTARDEPYACLQCGRPAQLALEAK